ncbi:MAG: hypothetical protein ACRD5J_11680 [Nitrososphaeraceae archaeon]
MTNTKKKKPDPDTIREIEHLQKVFGTDLRNYSHTGYQRSELPYTVRDATKGNKRTRK